MRDESASTCLTSIELDAVLAGVGHDERLAAHLERCAVCRDALVEQRANNALLAQLRSTTVPSAAPQPLIPGYEILEEIHRGAQGVVFRAVQKSAHRTVALKLLLAGAFATSQQRQRFEREIELVAGLAHPNIVTIHESGTTSTGQLYFAMQLIDGVPLNAWTARTRGGARGVHSRASMRDALGVFCKICRAVNDAHMHGVIHRDLKPANILIDCQDEPHVVDFGLAKAAQAVESIPGRDVTQPGVFMGTAVYASPEQVSGDPSGVDTRSDVYALGVILYEMTTGALPFDESASFSDIVRAITERDPPRPSARVRFQAPIDRDLETIILTAMTKQRERRYQSAAALADDVDRYLQGRAIDARRDSRWYVARKAIMRHRAAALVALAFVLLLAASSVALGILYTRATTDARRVRTINLFLEDTLASIEPSAPAGATMQDFFDEARHWVDLVLGDDPEAEASVRLIIGNGYRNLGRFADAERELQRSLDMRRTQYGENHVEFAKGLNALGQLRLDQGRLDEAEALIARALMIRKDRLGPDSLDGALNQATLARVHVAQGRLADAEALLRQSLAT